MDTRIDPTLLGFDFDGVIANTAEAFIRIACEQYDICEIELEQITRFQVEECLDMKVELIENIFNQILHDSVGTGLKPMPGAVRVIEELTSQAPVTIVTARPIADPVHRWLDLHMPADTLSRIRVVAMGDHDDKARHIKALELDYFIDDRAETCLQLEREGIRSILYAQPWNRISHNLPTVEGWSDIRDLCL